MGIKILIKLGADVNAINNNGETAIFNALERGNTDFVRFLVKSGADVNRTLPYGTSPLFYSTSNIDSLKLLLFAGALVNVRTRYGQHIYGFYRGQHGKAVVPDDIVSVLVAAGDMSEINPGTNQTDITSLKSLCKNKIRNVLMEREQKPDFQGQFEACINLFVKVPRLGIPPLLCTYLLNATITTEEIKNTCSQ